MQTPFFDRKTTGILKGIALCLMFWHHFFTLPEFWEGSVYYPLLEKLAPYFAEPCKICVPIFCFLSGYFYYYNPAKNYRYSLRKITDILLTYWAVFLLFALLAVLAAHYRYTPSELFRELFALGERPTMRFCWYVPFYILFLLLLPLLARCMGKHFLWDSLLSFLLLPLLLMGAAHFIPEASLADAFDDLRQWFPCVLAGYICAAYSLLEKTDALVRRILPQRGGRLAVCLLAVLLIPMGRYLCPELVLRSPALPLLRKSYSFRLRLDILYAPLYIAALIELVRALPWRRIQRVLELIGKYSLWMWFVSCIFFNNAASVFQPLLYFPRFPPLVFLWGLVLCGGLSFLLERIVSPLTKAKNRLLFSDGGTK